MNVSEHKQKIESFIDPGTWKAGHKLVVNIYHATVHSKLLTGLLKSAHNKKETV